MDLTVKFLQPDDKYILLLIYFTLQPIGSIKSDVMHDNALVINGYCEFQLCLAATNTFSVWMQDVQKVSPVETKLLSLCNQSMSLHAWPGRFDSSNDVSGFNQAKSSVVRGIRAKLLDNYPPIADYIDNILPKKEPVQILKW